MSDADGAAEAIESRDGQGVAVAEFADQFIKFRSARFCPAGVIEVAVLSRDACPGERIYLMVGVLNWGGGARWLCNFDVSRPWARYSINTSFRDTHPAILIERSARREQCPKDPSHAIPCPKTNVRGL